MRNRNYFSIIILASFGYLFFKAGDEFSLLIKNFDSIKWQAGFYLMILVMVVIGFLAALYLFLPEILIGRIGKILQWRNRMSVGRWVLFLLPLAAVIIMLQYSIYGDIIYSPAIRYSLGLELILLGGFLLAKERDIISLSSLTGATLVVISGFTAAVDFIGVTNYPFSLGWSEGNRLWDYSVLFGGRLYDYPQDQRIFSYTDFGRQLVGGIVYLFDGVTIWLARFWRELMGTLLYAIFGWVIFRRIGEKGKTLVLLGLWVYLFINQGPIHPPLVVCAILVSMAWGRSYWVAVPLLLVSGYFVQMSRFTWIFAPGMWILMLEISEKKVSKTIGKTWFRPFVLAMAGLTGSIILPAVRRFLFNSEITSPEIVNSGAIDSTTEAIGGALNQGLLWYRLLPSATYSPGVLLGLLQAIVPIVLVLGYMLVTRRWQMHIWQKLTIGGMLAAFLAVGLIVSTKIGGGGDLHNLDMLLIGLVFASVIAWRDGGRELFSKADKPSLLIQAAILIIVTLPGWRNLTIMKPLEHRATVEEVEIALDLIQEQTEIALEGGHVLFMDQRQLLTFGYVQAPLVNEYEKKYVMDQALNGDASYFSEYYHLLADGYFDLIITEPLHTFRRGSEFIFGEENDAWVNWVSAPTLCFYEEMSAPKFIRNNIGVVLLVPKVDTSECAVFLQQNNTN